MNQPVSSCRTQFEKRLKQARKRCTDGKWAAPSHPAGAENPSPTTTSPFACYAQGAAMDMNTSPDTLTEIDSVHMSYPVEEYPGVAQTYGCGPMFLDKFDSSGHSDYHCQDLPFYLFSS